jgi:hypothetical protein
MFTEIKADVPLFLPEKNAPIHAQLEINLDQPGGYIGKRREGRITLEFENLEVADALVDHIRFNNLMGLNLGWSRISNDVPPEKERQAEPYRLTRNEQQLADKLDDAGLSKEHREEWVREIVVAAMRRARLEA